MNKTAQNNQANLPLRTAAFAAVAANVAYNYVYPQLLGTPRMDVISDKYHNLFTPAGYAFSIWGLIYLSLLIYGAYGLTEKARSNHSIDQIAPWLIAVSLLSIAWVSVFPNDQIPLSAAIIAAMLAITLVMLHQARVSVLRGQSSAWLAVPFSLYAGWLTAATIANGAILGRWAGYSGSPLGAEGWAIGLLGIAALLGVGVGFRYRDFVFPLVIAWASAAIAVEQKGAHKPISYTVYACVGLLAAASVILMKRRARSLG